MIILVAGSTMLFVAWWITQDVVHIFHQYIKHKSRKLQTSSQSWIHSKEKHIISSFARFSWLPPGNVTWELVENPTVHDKLRHDDQTTCVMFHQAGLNYWRLNYIK